jgi:hypothetical protein
MVTFSLKKRDDFAPYLNVFLSVEEMACFHQKATNNLAFGRNIRGTNTITTSDPAKSQWYV